MANLLSAGNNLSGNWNAETSNRIPAVSGYLGLNVDRFSETFTAPNIINSAVGCVFMIDDFTSGTRGVWTLTLQEDATGAFSGSEINAATATVDMDARSLHDGDQFYYLELSSPYQFTTINSDSYRWKFRSDSGSQANRVRQSSTSASNFCYICFDDRTSIPINNDSLFVVHSGIKIDANITIGNGTTGKGWVWTHALYILGEGDIDFDNGGSYKLACDGTITAHANGQLGSGIELDSSVTGMIEFTPAADGDYYIWINRGSRAHLKGAVRDVSAMFSSGDGSTGSPLRTDIDIGLVVDDFIIITATNDFEQTEEKYLKSGSHAAGWVLSDTPAGAESALSFTHTTAAYIISMTRNLKIRSNDFNKGWILDDDKLNTDDMIYHSDNNSIYNYIELYYAEVILTDYNFIGGVFYRTTSDGIGFRAVTKAANTHSYNVYARCDNMTSGSDYMVSMGGAKGQIENDSFYVRSNSNALQISGALNNWNRCKFLDLNWVDQANGGGLGRISTPINLKFNNCEFDGCQRNTMRIRSNAIDCVFENCSFGKNIPSPKTIDPDVDLYFWTLLFKNCEFNDTVIGDDLDLHGGLLGSKISVHKYDETDNRHIVYETNGDFESCGEGLPDATVRTSGHLTARFSPRDETVGIVREFLIPAAGLSSVSWIGFINENTAFFNDPNAVCKVDLFLPGSTNPDLTCTFSSRVLAANSFEPCSVFGSYEGSISSLARILITVRSATPGAYVYIADFWNGTNELTNLNTWENAELTPVMMQDFSNPASVWEVVRNAVKTPGTMGDHVNRIQNFNR